ncbi:hypothetical protein JQ628_20445 [Bradyrhizobium lablabi]|uniref:hypothetical protein n=1 Tax=Bradyrhizobium lablabi TaxID=722472 RepID=UPI001BA50DCE|nr:hypothetical protein [Bradyrhizobium lablabi]MBR1123909.1 hypothetical protein [Bradyrhizobium lablabi]
MSARTASLALAAVAALVSVSAAQAGMNNLNLNTPSLPRPIDVRPRMIDAKIQLHCTFRRERNESGAWVERRYCH